MILQMSSSMTFSYTLHDILETNQLILGARFADVSSVFSFQNDCKALAVTFNYEVHRKNNVSLTEIFY